MSDVLMTGTPFGSVADVTGVPADVFDEDTGTQYIKTGGGHVGIDLGVGVAFACSSIQFFPRAGFPEQMVPGKFQGSNNGTDYSDLYTVSGTPDAGWNTVTPTDTTTTFRYFRFFQEPADVVAVAEIGFYRSGTPTAITLTAPASINKLVGSGNFTVELDAAADGDTAIALDDDGAGGWFYPSTLTILDGQTSGTFQYIASSTAEVTITASSAGLTSDDATLTPGVKLSRWRITDTPTLVVGDTGYELGVQADGANVVSAVRPRDPADETARWIFSGNPTLSTDVADYANLRIEGQPPTAYVSQAANWVVLEYAATVNDGDAWQACGTIAGVSSPSTVYPQSGIVAEGGPGEDGWTAPDAWPAPLTVLTGFGRRARLGNRRFARPVSSAIYSEAGSPTIDIGGLLEDGSGYYYEAAAAAESNPFVFLFHLLNTGGATLQYTLASNAAWLRPLVESGTVVPGNDQAINVILDPDDMSVGLNEGTLTITDSDATNSPLVIRVDITVT